MTPGYCSFWKKREKKLETTILELAGIRSAVNATGNSLLYALFCTEQERLRNGSFLHYLVS